MATVSSTLKMNDKMSGVLRNITRAMNSTLSVMENVDGASSEVFQRAKRDAGLASAAVDDYANSFNQIPQGAQNAAHSAGKSFDDMIGKAVKLTAVVYGIKKAFDLTQKAMNISDQLISSTGRLGLLSEQMPSLSMEFDMSSAEGQAAKLVTLQEQVFASAQRARSGYFDTMDAVSSFGTNAGDAFSSTEEIVAFSELLNKSFKLGAKDAQAQAGAMRQLTQALASGVLRGDEFVSITEQAPVVYQAIADYLQKTKGELRDLSSEGVLSADIVKNAMFMAADSIEGKFSSLSMTFDDQMTLMKNNALLAFQPVLTRLNQMLNDPAVQAALRDITASFYVLADGAQWALGAIANGAQWAYGHIDQIKTGVLLLGLVIGGVASASAIAWAVANWPILLMIGSIMLVVAALEHMGVTSDQVLEGVMGGFSVAGAVAGNVFRTWLLRVTGSIEYMWNHFAAFANFFGNVFVDPVGSVINLFADLADNALGVLEKIATAMDLLFGSNLADTVAGWRSNLAGMAEKAVAEYGSGMYEKRAGELDVNALLGDMGIDFDHLSYGKAWEKGTSAAKGISDRLSDMSDQLSGMMDSAAMLNDYSGFGFDTIGNIDKVGSVGRIEDDITISDEDIKMLKDIAALDYQLNLTQLTPSLVAQFGDVHETADAGAILEFIEDTVTEALSSSLVVTD